MRNEVPGKKQGGRSAALAFTAVAACGVLIYTLYSGNSAGREAGVMAALKELRRAQGDFRREDRDGDGYLEYALRLGNLYEIDAGNRPGLIEPALAETCDETATGDLFGYRFYAMRGITLEGRRTPYSTAADGNGTLDGFTIAALPVDTGRQGHRGYFLSEAGEIWTVALSGEREKAQFLEYAPERR
ncbi:MAG: DUF2950 family protein [Planctomycetes bacterium]|nr:DUF2950 family protein [Planctomycetota bacterium]